MRAPWKPFLLLLGAISVAACAAGGEQRGDETFVPEVADPAYPAGSGPRVVIDGGHHNYHKVDGRYRGFAELLRRDGFVVEGSAAELTDGMLGAIDVLVIANALSAANEESWTLPNAGAFTESEIDAVRSWVENGGALLLIADHMPMPGAAAELARAFGVLFHDGFARDPEDQGTMTFRRGDGTGEDPARDGWLAAHSVTMSPTPDSVPFVTTFTGQAFRLAPGIVATPLMMLPAGSTLLLPSEAWEFDDTTPRIPADGMLQGVLMRHGTGRLAVFGEAAMFSAQVQIRGDERFPMGMNHADAPHNARFARNVVRWLAGDLDSD